ncbi:MAG TPA: DUF2283 domain-containing protein [Chloroflexota bacterium]
MRMTYDAESDVAYPYLNDGSDAPVDHSDELGGEQSGLVVDYNAAGDVAGIEVMGARRRFGSSGATSVQLDVLNAAATAAAGR